MSYPGSLSEAKSTIKSLETNAHMTQSHNLVNTGSDNSGMKKSEKTKGATKGGKSMFAEANKRNK